MSELYRRFLAHVPKGGKILDAGCGSGRDTHYFRQLGFDVEAFDASAEMCRLATELTGRIVQQKTFEQFDSVLAFDAVWACASILYVRRDSIDSVLEKLSAALKPTGVMFLSFKLWDGEWEEGGRFFNSYDECALRSLLQDHPLLQIESIWISNDMRPNRAGEKWLNALLRKVQ
jgi:SAM-dependent methyltransferase